MNWEKSLQIVIDVLLSNGIPNQKYEQLIGNHLPIVAVNTDYLWMSEATNPRYILVHWAIPEKNCAPYVEEVYFGRDENIFFLFFPDPPWIFGPTGGPIN